MKSIIVEDEPDNIALLTHLLKDYCKQVEVTGIAKTAGEGTAMILSQKPDLVFLDIGLPDESGFSMLENLGDYNFDVIFITIHDHFGIQAIKCSALDYLLKPVQPDELKKAVKKAEAKQRNFQTAEQITNMLSFIRHSGLTGHRLGLPMSREVRFVNPDEILRCEAANNYTYFYTVSKEKLVVSKGIYEYDEMLAPYRIVRCHQSHLVNIKHIKGLERDGSINELVLIDGSRVPVSRLKLDDVKRALANR